VVLYLLEFHLFSFVKVHELARIIYIYWPIEYIPKALFDKVFKLAKIIYIYWPIEFTLKVLLTRCLNFRELPTSIDHFNALKKCFIC
jgi:hypothetical protein